MINCDGEKTDKFLPLKLEIRTKTQNRDVFEETFGIKSFRHYSTENMMHKMKFDFKEKGDTATAKPTPTSEEQAKLEDTAEEKWNFM